MYTYNCHFFFSSDTFVRARTFIRNVGGGWAQFDRWGHVAGGLGAIRAVCRAWQAFKTLLALGTDKANPRVSATSRGLGFPHPRSPCTCVRFGEAVFSARIFSVIFSRSSHMTDSRQHAESTTPHTTLPHSSSSRQHHVCVRSVSSLCCGELLVSEPVIYHRTIARVSAVLPLCVRVSTVPSLRERLYFTYVRF